MRQPQSSIPRKACLLVVLQLLASITTALVPRFPVSIQAQLATRSRSSGRGLLVSAFDPTTSRHNCRTYALKSKSNTNKSDDEDEEQTLEASSISPTNDSDSNPEQNAANTKPLKPAKPPTPQASKRKMLSFALPALGIFLCNPLLSNIDNAFVGKTVGTQGLAALSPATICTDQMIYLFSFLGRATTGLVSRSYNYNDETGTGDTQAAREAAAAPLSVALIAGTLVTLLYAFFTPHMLSALNVAPSLRGPAATYIYWRGAIVWAALAQNVALNIQLATRDVMTPLKIVGLAAAFNVVGDAFCCAWPLRMGCGGAAAATAFATLASSSFMVLSLKRKQLLPKLKIPNKQEIVDLLEFTGPLLAITVTRLLGSINMQRAASRLGLNHLAAYQMSINLMFLFMLFGEPLSQLSQTQLPALVDSKQAKGPLIRATLKSILALAVMAAVGVGGVAGLTLSMGTRMFSSDVAVQALAKSVAPSLFLAVATGIFTVAVDGAMLASRDFGFMMLQGTLSLLIQCKLLSSPWCTSVSAVFATFTLRLGSYALLGLTRVALGYGPLGNALRQKEIPGDDEINGVALAI